MWDIDVSALSTAQKPQKMFVMEGKIQVGFITSAEIDRMSQ
jgi:hypothetical protein